MNVLFIRLFTSIIIQYIVLRSATGCEICDVFEMWLHVIPQV